MLDTSTESVTMAFLSTQRLGLSAGQRYYGFSFFAEDVDPAIHTLTDPSTFPDDTADDNIVPGDGADIYGGVSGYFLAEHLSVATGTLFNDENPDGVHGENEAGISGVTLTLFEDTDNNGVFDPAIDQQVGDSLESGVSGSSYSPGWQMAVISCCSTNQMMTYLQGYLWWQATTRFRLSYPAVMLT